MANSKNRQAFINQFNAEKYEQLAIRIPKGSRERYKQAAAACGTSLARFVVDSVEKEIRERVPEYKQN